MGFKIFINDKLKDKSIRNLYTFINKLQSVDWRLFYYGFDFLHPKCGSIPTNYGCIIFTPFFYHEAKLIEYADDSETRDKMMILRKKLEESSVDIETELFSERDVIKKIASKHPDVVKSVGIELILPLKVDTIQEREDAEKFFKRQHRRMKELANFSEYIPEPFDNAEVWQWDLPLADPREVGKMMKHIRGEGEEEFRIGMLGNGVIAYLEEEQKEKVYVMILTGVPDAELTIKELEKCLDEALAPIKQCISKKTCFVTLHGCLGDFY